MKPAILLIALVGMLAMGVRAFWGMAALWSYRVTQPLPHTASAVPEAADPIRALQTGVQRDLQLAQSALESDDVTEVARALDGARRIALVGHFAADPLFARPLGTIERARRAAQNHQRAEAERAIQEGLSTVAAESPTGAGQLTARPPGSDLKRYEGAVVLDASGVRIGRIKVVNSTAAVLVLGGKQDLFGFINVGGHEVSVPLRELVFGEAKKFGPTMVAMPQRAAPAFAGDRASR